MKATRTYTMAARAEGVVAARERIARAAMELFLAQPFDDVTLAATPAMKAASRPAKPSMDKALRIEAPLSA